MSYPFVVISLHCLKEVSINRGTRRINVETAGMECSVSKVEEKLNLACISGVNKETEIASIHESWNLRYQSKNYFSNNHIH